MLSAGTRNGKKKTKKTQTLHVTWYLIFTVQTEAQSHIRLIINLLLELQNAFAFRISTNFYNFYVHL